MSYERGFSIFELLIVVAVISVIAAIAIPNLLAARQSANEGSAISSLRTLYGANVTFANTNGSGEYAGVAGSPGTSSLTALVDVNLIDVSFSAGEKSGYRFIGDRTPASATAISTFYFAANPSTVSGPLQSGTRRFGVATDGVVRGDADQGSLATPFNAASLLASPALPHAD